MTYIPKPSHAIAYVLLGTALISASTWTDLAAMTIGGALSWIIAIIIMALLILEARRQFYETAASFSRELSRLDPDQWSALGIAFPQLRVHWAGSPVVFFENTDATMDDFERFMQDSDGRQISPARNWSTGPERRRWQSIKGWLERMGYIYAESAAGSHSWLWRGDMRRIIWQRYIDPLKRNVPDLTEIDGAAAPIAIMNEIDG